MTQEAECEKTRAPNHLFARLRKNGEGGREGCEHLESDAVLLGTPLTEIHKHNSEFFLFFSHTIRRRRSVLFCFSQ